ncbi:MAG: radical SAM protein [Candidatus Aegiribacteria sp.]|nr:radical SAM protein [Candidatus Aegiribacteria sp.]
MNKLFSSNILRLVGNALKINNGKPASGLFLLRYSRHFRKSMKLREHYDKKGIHVPPILIFSITHSCNLKCRGCYARARDRGGNGNSLDSAKIREVITEARDLGVSIILIAGGEPLIQPDIIRIMGDFPSIVFPLFTNGTLVDDRMLESFRKHRQIIPIISVEGPEAETDLRRGKGTFRSIEAVMKKMEEARLFFGTSITLTKSNYGLLSDDDFIGNLVDSGCRIIFFIEYVPLEEGTEARCLTAEQQKSIAPALAVLREKFSSLFIALPGEEEQYGGCLAAGRGFIHISASGDLEPCPFAPFSDINLNDVTLKEGLGSAFLQTIRKNHSMLTESMGGCALWENRNWVASVLEESRQ